MANQRDNDRIEFAATTAAAAIIDDLTRRRVLALKGFDHMWEDINDKVRLEIATSIKDAVAREMRGLDEMRKLDPTWAPADDEDEDDDDEDDEDGMRVYAIPLKLDAQGNLPPRQKLHILTCAEPIRIEHGFEDGRHTARLYVCANDDDTHEDVWLYTTTASTTGGGPAIRLHKNDEGCALVTVPILYIGSS